MANCKVMKYLATIGCGMFGTINGQCREFKKVQFLVDKPKMESSPVNIKLYIGPVVMH